MDLMEIGWKFADWINLDLNRDQWRVLVDTCSVKGGEFLDQLSDC
jgi:hypothetical protein